MIAKGKAAGKIPASDRDRGGACQASRATAISSEGSLAALATKAASSAKGELASQTADAYLGQGNYAKAIELYKLALQKGVANADEVNLHLGIAAGDVGRQGGGGDSVRDRFRPRRPRMSRRCGRPGLGAALPRRAGCRNRGADRRCRDGALCGRPGRLSIDDRDAGLLLRRCGSSARS